MGTPADTAGTAAEVKRFRELWVGDDRFRAAVAADPEGATRAAGLGIDPRPLAVLWRGEPAPDGTTPEGRGLLAGERRAQDYFDFADDDGGAAGPYRRWRARQRARAAFSHGPVMAPMALHLPFAVEITQGCSVGCWFCGVSAQRLTGTLETDPGRWAATLGALRDVFGGSAARGFLYWATDPLDHPDYEAHAETFREVLGRFPATTTALPLADPARTRRLVELARAGDCPGLRFSVLTRRLLGRVHEAFSAWEMRDVDLALVNRESVLAIADAGRARSQPDRLEAAREAKGTPPGGDWGHHTISCVSGFLIEAVPGRIRLITPEPASDRWPDGFAVLDEGRFAGPDGLARELQRMVADNMADEPPDRLALQRGVAVAGRGRHAATARGNGHQVEITSQRRDIGHVPELAAAFRGGASVAGAAADAARRFDVAPETALKDVASLWRQGILVEPAFDRADCDDRADAA